MNDFFNRWLWELQKINRIWRTSLRVIYKQARQHSCSGACACDVTTGSLVVSPSLSNRIGVSLSAITFSFPTFVVYFAPTFLSQVLVALLLGFYCYFSTGTLIWSRLAGVIKYFRKLFSISFNLFCTFLWPFPSFLPANFESRYILRFEQYLYDLFPLLSIRFFGI